MLESKHVIGLFLLMLLFSGVFFTLGYVMGRNQYDGQVRAASSNARIPEPDVAPKPEPALKRTAEDSPNASESDPATSNNNSDWEFYGSSKPAKKEPHLEPVAKTPATPPASRTVNAKARVEPATPATARNSKPVTNAPLIPNGALVLQVAALTRQDDALSIANSLQKKRFAAYVQMPQKDKFYRVQVGPFKDKKIADAAKRGLESEGFKAFYVNR